jgi:hypothetical protein
MYEIAITHFELCIEKCQTQTDTLLAVVTNSGQWARLRRQGLPLQLSPSWARLLARKMDHCAQLCAMRKTATFEGTSERDVELASLARGAEDTAFQAVVAARNLLLDQKFLLQTQIGLIHECYIASLEEAHSIRVQCLLQDAEIALYTGKSSFTNILLHDCLVSAKIAFNRDSEKEKMSRVSKTVESLKRLSLVARSVTTPNDEKGVEDWRRHLPRVRYTDIAH